MWGLAQRTGLTELLGPACPERNAALAPVVSQVVEPASKAAYGT